MVSGGAPGFKASNAGDGFVLLGSGVAVDARSAERSDRGLAGMGRSGRKSAVPEPPSPLDVAALVGSPPLMLIPAGPNPPPV
jgi:hypothetical protein